MKNCYYCNGTINENDYVYVTSEFKLVAHPACFAYNNSDYNEVPEYGFVKKQDDKKGK